MGARTNSAMNQRSQASNGGNMMQTNVSDIDNQINAFSAGFGGQNSNMNRNIAPNEAEQRH